MVTRIVEWLPQIVRWLPRILVLLFCGFLALFALDIFGEGYSFVETIVGLFMHLIPNFLLLIALAIAWRYPVAGGVLFMALGVLSIFAFHTTEDWNDGGWIGFLLISFPAFAIGVLFLLDGWYRRRGLDGVVSGA